VERLRAWVTVWLLGSVLMTGSHAQEEVPFITTPDSVTLAMLEMAQVKASDHVIDLGSGDGRIVITAARRFGATGLGVEIVPDLVKRSRESAAKAGVQAKVAFETQDLFATDLSQASVITMYLLPDFNMMLRERLLALKPGTRVVSHDWDMGDWQPDVSKTLDVPDKTIGRDKRSRIMMWVVPANLAGLWCAGTVSMQVQQRFNRVTITTQRAGAAAAVTHVLDAVFAGMSGRELRGIVPTSLTQLLLAPDGRLQWQQSSHPSTADLNGVHFARSDQVRCP
jgi:SAM-dependent methyltransferase